MPIFRLPDGRVVGGGIQQAWSKSFPEVPAEEWEDKYTVDVLCWSELINHMDATNEGYYETGTTPADEVEEGEEVYCSVCDKPSYGPKGAYICWECQDG